MSTRTGQPCGAAAIRGRDYCVCHSGLGVASDPAKYAPLAAAKKRENAQVRASMRLLLGNTRVMSPRNVLRARATVEAERLADRAVNGALSDKVDDATGAKLAMALIDQVDPPVEASVEVKFPQSAEDVDKLSYRELLALADELGIRPSSEVTTS
jgi:hypothetical protein